MLCTVFDIVTGEPFKQSAELTGEPIKMKGEMEHWAHLRGGLGPVVAAVVVQDCAAELAVLQPQSHSVRV